MKQLQYIWKTSILKIYNIKFATFAVVILVTCWSYNRPVKMFINAVNYPISWCLFPFFMSTFPFLILFWFGIVYLNSDIPFMQRTNLYQILRAGRRRWVIGQLGGIFLRSCIAVLFTAFCTILTLLPNLQMTNEWGKLLRTVAVTDAMIAYDFKYVIYYEIFNTYTPLQLMSSSLLICILVSTFMGIFMFLVCLYFNRVIAVTGALVMSILLFFVVNIHPRLKQKLAFFVPTIWAEVARISSPEYGFYWLPSILYMLLFLTIGISLMSVLIIYKVKHIEFNWNNDDV